MIPVYDLSVVVPARDESRRLPGTLRALLPWLSSLKLSFEVWVSDDGSRDGTPSVTVSYPGVRALCLPRKGKGHAVRRGVLVARGQRILVLDADLPCPLEDLEAMLSLSAPVVAGSRYAPGASAERAPLRLLASSAFRLLCRRLLPEVSDPQCGVKLYEFYASRAIFSRQKLDGFAADLEALLIAKELGFEIAEHPLRWREVPGSRVSLLRDSPRVFLDLVFLAARFRTA